MLFLVFHSFQNLRALIDVEDQKDYLEATRTYP